MEKAEGGRKVFVEAVTSIAAIEGEQSEAAQPLLARVAALWRGRGLSVAGVVAETHAMPDRSCSAGVLRSVAGGDAYSIYLEELPSGRVCHLDAAGVEAACAATLGQIPDCDVVVLSKFGKLEAAGGGLVPAFAAAIAAGRPLITSVSAKHRDAWRRFAPQAVCVAADEASILKHFAAKLPVGEEAAGAASASG